MTSYTKPAGRLTYRNRSLIVRVAVAALLCVFCLSTIPSATSAAENPSGKKNYAIAPADAAESLKQFVEQSGEQVFYLLKNVQGVKTNAVNGQLTAREALHLLVARTKLEVVEDSRSGAFTVRRQESVPAPAKSTESRSSLAKPDEEEQVVQMSPFEVTSDKDRGYRKTNTVTTSRVAIPVVKNPQAVEVISGDLLRDFEATKMLEAFRYSASVTVNPSRTQANGIYTLRAFQMPTFYNGVAVPNSNSPPQLAMSNIDRIEIAKGPVGLFYGASTPNGVANFITKKPEFHQATRVDLAVGNYKYNSAVFDTQAVLNADMGLAYRLIGSYGNHTGRTDYQDRSDLLIAPSFLYRPNNKVEFSVEYNYSKSQTPKSNNAQGLFTNQQYFKDVTSPSQQILNYMKATYGLTTDAQAQAKVQERWGFPVSWGTFINNWYNDIYAMTGVQPFQQQGSTIDWWRFSTRGDKYAQNTVESNLDSFSHLIDSGLVFTPFDSLSVKFRWIRMQNNAAVIQLLTLPYGGLRPDGRFIRSSVMIGANYQPRDTRKSTNDTKQVDISYEKEAFGMKHNLMVGAQYDRLTFATGLAVFDFTKGKPVKDANGNTVIDAVTGVALTGADVYRWWDPFGPYPIPPLYDVGGGVPTILFGNGSYFKAYYASYRGSALDDKLNVLAGIRRTESVTLGKSDTTPTIGAIYQALPGLHVFASWSKTITFVNQMSVTGAGVLPSDNAHPLDNELDDGIEVGIKTDWRDNTVSGTISYFKDERAGMVLGDTVRTLEDPRVISQDPATRVSFYVNGGLARAEGIDTDLSWTPQPNLQFLLNATWLKTANTITDPSLDPSTPGKVANRKFHYRLIQSPVWKANFVTKYDIPTGLFKNLTVGGAIRYSDEFEGSDSATIQITAPQETFYDLFAAYSTKWGKIPTSLKVNLINIGDTYNDVTRQDGFECRFTLSFDL